MLPVVKLEKASVQVHVRQLRVLPHTFGTLTQMKVCVVVQSAMRMVLTTICAAMLVQLARPFSALTAGLRTRVLLRHCVLVRPVTRVVLTTICAATRTSIVLVLGLRAVLTAVTRFLQLLLLSRGMAVLARCSTVQRCLAIMVRANVRAQ